MSDEITRRTFIGTAAAIVLAPAADAASQQAAANRRTLLAAVDRIIPAQGKMPAASAVGAVAYVETISARDQDIAQRLARALTTLGTSFAESPENEQVSALERLEQRPSARSTTRKLSSAFDFTPGAAFRLKAEATPRGTYACRRVASDSSTTSRCASASAPRTPA